MGGSISAGADNDEMIDNLIKSRYIRTNIVEKVFRSVDRAFYFLAEFQHTAYRDLAWKQGNLHLSAPCIYSEVLEHLKLEPGHSFLNIGSGTGYLSTLAGLILGPYGTNHGIEAHADVVEYAYGKLEQFKKTCNGVDVFEFCEPVFIVGNAFNLNQDRRYDRIYCGAACPESHQEHIKKFMKELDQKLGPPRARVMHFTRGGPSFWSSSREHSNNVGTQNQRSAYGVSAVYVNSKWSKVGGILVLPCEDDLLKIVRTSEETWEISSVLPVSFSTLQFPADQNTSPMISMPEPEPLRLQEICRSAVRSLLRSMVEIEEPELTQKRKYKQRSGSRKTYPEENCVVIPVFEDTAGIESAFTIQSSRFENFRPVAFERLIRNLARNYQNLNDNAYEADASGLLPFGNEDAHENETPPCDTNRIQIGRRRRQHQHHHHHHHHDQDQNSNQAVDDRVERNSVFVNDASKMDSTEPFGRSGGDVNDDVDDDYGSVGGSGDGSVNTRCTMGGNNADGIRVNENGNGSENKITTDCNDNYDDSCVSTSKSGCVSATSSSSSSSGGSGGNDVDDDGDDGVNDCKSSAATHDNINLDVIRDGETKEEKCLNGDSDSGPKTYSNCSASRVTGDESVNLETLSSPSPSSSIPSKPHQIAIKLRKGRFATKIKTTKKHCSSARNDLHRNAWKQALDEGEGEEEATNDRDRQPKKVMKREKLDSGISEESDDGKFSVSNESSFAESTSTNNDLMEIDSDQDSDFTEDSSYEEDSSDVEQSEARTSSSGSLCLKYRMSMEKKIQTLPLPKAVKFYLNYDRDFLSSV